MIWDGGCYCGAVRDVARGKPALKAQRHCRECQYMTGGGPNFFMMMPANGIRHVQGTPRSFTRSDLVTREFCGDCGTHLPTRIPGFDKVVPKVGPLDDPAAFGEPQMAIYTVDEQPFHTIPDGFPRSSGCPPDDIAHDPRPRARPCRDSRSADPLYL